MVEIGLTDLTKSGGRVPPYSPTSDIPALILQRMQFLGLHRRGTCLTVYVYRAVGIGGGGGGRSPDRPSKILQDSGARG